MPLLTFTVPVNGILPDKPVAEAILSVPGLCSIRFPAPEIVRLTLQINVPEISIVFPVLREALAVSVISSSISM